MKGETNKKKNRIFDVKVVSSGTKNEANPKSKKGVSPLTLMQICGAYHRQRICWLLAVGWIMQNHFTHQICKTTRIIMTNTVGDIHICTVLYIQGA